MDETLYNENLSKPSALPESIEDGKYRFVYLTTVEQFEKFEEVVQTWCIPHGDIDKVIIVMYHGESRMGQVSVSIYSTNTVKRKSNWNFMANRKRSAWIDRIDTVNHGVGVGRILLEKAKDWVNSRISLCSKENLYTASLKGAMNFYRKCGYQLINTPARDGDEDYISTYNAEVAEHMALPLQNSKLDREVLRYDSEDSLYTLHLVLEGEPDRDNILGQLEEIVKKSDEDDKWWLFADCLIYGVDSNFKKLHDILINDPTFDLKSYMTDLLDCLNRKCHYNCMHSPTHDFAFMKDRQNIHKFVDHWTDLLKASVKA